ncbi:FG-GAP repeat protein, partial [Labrenzia sp. OB1]|uniref:FG-GAP repeat protein n=1 Tax=Labrenzia sp. OB1 TaxID=1561204 RepID=UPI0007B30505
GGITNSGAIYVYEPDGSGGYAETRIVALDVYPDDRFGYSLDINDNGTIVAGAYNNDDAGANSGSAYVFVPDGAGGYTQYKLTAPDAAAADKFGISVSINSDGVVSIGAQAGDGAVADTGAVYTFVPNGDGDYVGYDGTIYTGVPLDGSASNPVTPDSITANKFTASDGAFADYFGASTAINDHGVVLVGAPLNDDPGANSGYIYLYRPDGSGGYSEQILNASIPIAGVQYGYSVALNNSEVAVVGSFDRNQVHVYQPDGNGGHFETKLLPAGTLYSDLFGHSVA